MAILCVFRPISSKLLIVMVFALLVVQVLLLQAFLKTWQEGLREPGGIIGPIKTLHSSTDSTLNEGLCIAESLAESLSSGGPLWHWIRARIEATQGYWEPFRNKEDPQVLVLVLPGLMRTTRMARELQAPKGDLLQWADVILALHVLNCVVILQDDFYQVSLWLMYDKFPIERKSNCRRDFDLIFLDIIAFKSLHTSVRERYRSRFRILDAYGTQAAFNSADQPFDQSLGKVSSLYSGLNLTLRQFGTFYPHTPENTFVGFVVLPVSKRQIVQKEEYALLYGKDDKYFCKARAYVKLLMSMTELHSTVEKKECLPEEVVNHGVLNHSQYLSLLEKSQALVGVGLPLESCAPVEALSRGTAFINPTFTTAADRNALREDGKPTARQLDSQVPYLRQLGEPYVYTINRYDGRQLRDTFSKLRGRKVVPMVPLDFQVPQFLSRISKWMHLAV